MAGIETAVEAARRYIIKRPRLTRLLDNANARVLMLIAPAGFGKTTLAREWVRRAAARLVPRHDRDGGRRGPDRRAR